MKVLIGNKLFESDKVPICLILNETNIKHIQSMPEKHRIYMSYPETMTEEKAEEQMVLAMKILNNEERNTWNVSFEKPKK